MFLCFSCNKYCYQNGVRPLQDCLNLSGPQTGAGVGVKSEIMVSV